MSDLRPGWVEARLGAVAETRLGKMLSAKARGGLSPLPYLRNKNVQWGTFDLSDVLEMDFEADELDRFAVWPGDLLICEGGEVGRAAIWRGQLSWIGYQKALHRVRPSVGVSAEYLMYSLHWFASRNAFEPFVTGSTIKHLPQEDLRRLPVPLAPTAEQRRIVTAIEEHFSRLDAAEVLLNAGQTRLVRLRRKTLDRAMQNESRYVEIGDLGRIVTGSTPPAERAELWGGDVPFITPGDLSPSGSIRSARRTLTKEGARYARLLPEKSILVTCIGATTGKTSLALMACATNQQINAVVPDQAVALPEFLLAVISSDRFQRMLLAEASNTTMPILNKKRFSRLSLPLPALAEQRRVVAFIEHELSLIDALVAEVDGALRRGKALRRSILEQAFTGRLVPQDPADEPASVLLERVAAERASAPKPTRARKKVRA